MALFISILKSKLVIRMTVAVQNTKYLIKNIHSNESKKNEVDIIDEFTTQLVQSKSDKWETMRNNKNITVYKVNRIIFNEFVMDIRRYKPAEIDGMLKDCLEQQDHEKIVLIINQCIEYKITPTKMLEKVLSFCAQNGHRDLIQSLQNLLEEVDPEYLKYNSSFTHYVAEVTWMRGNITESLRLFEEVYRNNLYLRRKIRLMIKYLITNITSQRSEAALVTIINFTEALVKEYDDYFLLACVWQACFLSEWYADQCTAANILERHKGFSHFIVHRIPFVINMSLRSHQPDTVHRLFEILLKYNMKTQYTRVLQALFNYRYWQNDLRSCSEIIQWSLTLNVALLSMQHEQFVALLLGQVETKKPIKKPKAAPHFQLKF